MKRRGHWLAGFIAITSALGAQAQPYPSKPLRMVVPFLPGGASDFAARIIGPRIGEALGQQIIIDNRGGAGGNVGMEVAARAAPDGYAMFFGNIGTLTINPHVYGRTLKIDPLREFVPVGLVSETTNLLTVHPSVPVRTAKEFIAFVKARPDQLNYASPGTGSLNHLQMELLRNMFGLKYVHVPYKGGAGPAVADVVGGHVTLTLQTLTSALPFVQSGRLRPLGVTAPVRVVYLPNVPTLSEQGIDLVSTSWQGMLFPAGTSPELVNRLHAAINQSLNVVEVRERLATGAQDLRLSTTPAEFGEYMRAESARWGKVVRAANVSLD
jgi:tripartite-type tricarboxylate transporter receptor subunit TctC